MFRNFILQNFPFLEDDFDALTDYELFCKMLGYVKTIVKNDEDFNARLTALENYINNLDLQEEVNYKLDEMAEDGTLENLISQYIQLQTTYTFSNIEQMKNATNLIEGCFTKTLGFYEIKDGGGSYYQIRKITNQDVIDNITLFAIANDNTLIAELLTVDNMSIKQFGAKGDGIKDDTIEIQTALNNAKNVYIPTTENYYKVTNSLELKSNQRIYGNGNLSNLLMPNGLEKKIFDIHDVENIIIENIKLCNESCQTGTSPELNKNILIYTENAENIIIKNCFFENAYSRGIEIFKTKNFHYINNIFKNATFDMLLLLPEVENAFIDKCVFDTITSNYQNTYLFATGRNDEETYNFSCKNIHVTNSKFLNNPNWEGIDSHGGNELYIENNYVSNCKIGIILNYGSTAPLTSDDIKHGNIYVKNNIIENAPSGQSYGIDIGTGGTSGFICKNVFIENNYVNGYGSSNTIGALHLINIKYLTVLNNNILNSQGSAVDMTNILYADIKSNKCININNDYGIHYIAGCWFINLIDNIIKNTSFNNTILWGVRSQLLNITQFINNDIVATNLYSSNGTIMNGIVNANTNQIGKIGNYAKNSYGIITHYATNSVIRPAKTETLTSISLSGDSNSNIVSGSNALYYLTEGEEIILQGAGTGGADMTTQIIEFINKDTFRVKDTIITSFSNSNPKTNAGTWVAV